MTARGLNRCAWCGKMASWRDLHSVHRIEMIDIHGTIAESDYYEHRGECPTQNRRAVRLEYIDQPGLSDHEY